ncbi:hypothetical protein BGZ75_003217 [Mortierella antarctica]|nr:hypothetical protein BGZ75_003217 [Mortierella antarctica]
MRTSRCSLILVLGAGIGLTSIDAQAAQPQPCGGSAFARVGNTFYIQGGATYADNLVQSMWALDLTTAWTTSQPAWKSLPPGPFNAYHSAGFNANNGTFLTFGRDTAAPANQIASSWLNSFDIRTGTWSSWNPVGLKDNSRRDFYAVTNAAANKIYILGGNASNDGRVIANQFNTYDPTTRALTEVDTPASGPQNSMTYAAVWVPRLSVMLVIGDADGSLVAIFGGYNTGSTTADPNAFILDTRTWTWTQVPYSGRGRGNTACAIVDDTFIIWGGFYDSNAGGVPSGSEALLLLSLSQKSWITSYTPSAAMTNPGGGGSTTGPKSGGLSTGAIVGIAGGAAALMVLIGTLVIIRRMKPKPAGDKTDIAEVESGTGAAPPKSDPPPHGVPPPAHAASSSYDPTLQSTPAPDYAYYYPQGQYPPNADGYTAPHHQPGYDYPEQFHQQQYYHPSPQIGEVHYVDGDSAAATAAAATGSGIPSVYYPPPPASSSEQGTPAQTTTAANSVSADTPAGSYKVLVRPAGSNEDEPYHDSYGMKHTSMLSTNDPAAIGGKRPVSAPQGGPGFGSEEIAPVPGAPQAILP